MTISFTSTLPILSTSQVVLSMPMWGAFSVTNFVATASCSNILNLSPSMSCSSRVSAPNEYVDVNNLFPTSTTSTTSFQMSISNMKNPPST